MEIELKNIQYREKQSEESYAFSANLYIEGQLVGTASNRGRGGPTAYLSIDENGRKLISDAEIYIATLPSDKLSGNVYFSMAHNLDSYIDHRVAEYLLEKEQKEFRKKIEGYMKKGIVVGIPDKTFGMWKFTDPLEKILSHPDGHEVLIRALIKNIIPTLSDGELILNTNIPESIFRAVGLKENQYVKQFSKDSVIKKNKKKPGRKM
jgi:hypothetical protein